MPFSDDQVFDLTKIIYKQIYQNFSENYIGEKEPLQQFQQNYIEPLYPSKKIQTNQKTQTNEQTHHRIFQYRHKYDKQIEEQFKNSSENQSTTSENSEEQTDVSYVSAIQRFSLKDLICKLRAGRFFCWKNTPPDHVYEDLGLGVCLYLKFLKHFVCILFMLIILSVISMSIYYQIAKSNKYNPGLNYQKVLFSLGVGSLSLQGIKCIHQNVTNSMIQFDLTCPVGAVRVLGPVYTQSRFQTLQTCKTDINSFIERKPNLYMNPVEYGHLTNCNNQLPNCTFNLTVASPNKNYGQISVTYECITGISKYGSANISRNAALYVTVIFDLIMIVSLMLFYWSESTAQKKEQKYFKQKQILLSAFTLQVGSFSKRNFHQQFSIFIDQLEKKIKKQNKLQINLRRCIVQVRLPDNDQYDNDQAKRQKAYRKLYDFIGEKFISKSIDPEKYIDGEDFRKSVFSSQSNFKSYRRKLSSLINNYRKTQKLRGKNHNQQLKIYIVFLKPKYKRLILQKTKIIVGKQIIQTEHGDYQINDPPAPSLVLWDNIGKNKLVRGIISWFISLVILLATYVLTAYILSLQNETIVGKYDFNIECQNVFPDQNYNVFNQQYYEQYKLSYTHCYCLSRSIIFSLNFQSVCNEWRDQYTLFLAIPILYGFGLFILNEFVSWIYRMLSSFEAHQYLTSQLYSYIIKKTILETTDLALIVVLLSIDFNKKSTTFDFLLIGSYDDFSADWHLQVGIIIIVNMFFNIFSPLIEGLFYLGQRLLQKLKLCLFNKKDIYQKTKINYIQHYRQNVFPLEQRYSSILTVLLITLALNFVYPIMNMILAITLLLYLLIDKFMIIKAYHKPVNFQGLLQKKIMKIFLIAIILHLIVTAIFITQPFLVVAGSISNQDSIQNQINSRVPNMFKVGYVLPYMILIVIILVSICIISASNQYLKTKPNPRIRIGLGGIPFEENKYYNLLDAYELDRVIALKRRQIQRNKILQKKYMKKMHEQLQELRQSYSNKPMIPTKKKDLKINVNKSILSQISQYSYYRLLKKKIKSSKQKDKLVKLAGMAAYEWQKDWIYFDEQVRLDYKIPQIDSYLNKISQQAQFRIKLIQGIIQIARNKSKIQGKQQKQIDKDDDVKQENEFKQIINESDVTSLEEQQGQNFFKIENPYFPILELENKILQMQKMKSKQKSKASKGSNNSEIKSLSREEIIGKNPELQRKTSKSNSKSQQKQTILFRQSLSKPINQNDIQINFVNSSQKSAENLNKKIQAQSIQQINSSEQQDNNNQILLQTKTQRSFVSQIQVQTDKQYKVDSVSIKQLPSEKVLLQKQKDDNQ